MQVGGLRECELHGARGGVGGERTCREKARLCTGVSVRRSVCCARSLGISCAWTASRGVTEGTTANLNGRADGEVTGSAVHVHRAYDGELERSEEIRGQSLCSCEDALGAAGAYVSTLAVVNVIPSIAGCRRTTGPLTSRSSAVASCKVRRRSVGPYKRPVGRRPFQRVDVSAFPRHTVPHGALNHGRRAGARDPTGPRA